jgi:NADPH-dependent ferric siderophore reductase
LTIDVFVHGEGPASRWAAGAAPGDQVAVSRPRARYDLDAQAPWVVLAGDETAAPAIGTILEADAAAASSPAGGITVVIECDGDDEDLGLPPRAAATFVHRTDTPGEALLAALTTLVPGEADGEGRVWVAGEARGIRRIRAHLLHERRLPATAIVTRGYWRLGEADHPDHDYGDD